jgi:membrane-associated phospholipid phosphatase
LAKLVSSGPLKDRSDPDAPTDGSPTHAGTILGTLDYMSPEQVRGLPADPRSDIFAFGVVLYEMLAGRRAFSRDSAADTLSAILHEDPPELDRLSSGISLPLIRIVKRCLEKRPEDRFSSAQDLGFALETISGVDAESAPPERKPRRHRRQSASKAEVAEGPAYEPTSIFPRAKEEAERVEQEQSEEDSRSRKAEESRKRRAVESKRRRAEESGKRREKEEKRRRDQDAERSAVEETALLRVSRREKVAAAILLALLFLVNYAETAIETWLRVRYGVGADLEKNLGEAAQWFERGLSFEQHDATNMIAVYGFSAVYFFLFPLLALLTVAAFARRKDSRPLLMLATAAVADYLLTLPFYLLFPVPERWTFPDANAVLLSDLWTSSLIQAFRPFSGLNNCFPSFHVSTTVIIVCCLYRYRAAFRTAAVPAAIAILLSTFTLGIHWLPDILAGLAAGWLSFWLAEKLLPLVQREIGAGAAVAEST